MIINGGVVLSVAIIIVFYGAGLTLSLSKDLAAVWFLLYLAAMYGIFLFKNGQDKKRIILDAGFVVIWMVSAAALEVFVHSFLNGKATLVALPLAVFFPYLPWWLVSFHISKKSNGSK